MVGQLAKVGRVVRHVLREPRRQIIFILDETVLVQVPARAVDWPQRTVLAPDLPPTLLRQLDRRRYILHLRRLLVARVEA